MRMCDVFDVLQVSSSCSSVYVDGSEARGSVNGSVLVKYGTYTGLARFTVWMPEFPLELGVPDVRLSQVKGWRVPDFHSGLGKARRKREYRGRGNRRRYDTAAREKRSAPDDARTTNEYNIVSEWNAHRNGGRRKRSNELSNGSGINLGNNLPAEDFNYGNSIEQTVSQRYRKRKHDKLRERDSVFGKSSESPHGDSPNQSADEPLDEYGNSVSNWDFLGARKIYNSGHDQRRSFTDNIHANLDKARRRKRSTTTADAIDEQLRSESRLDALGQTNIRREKRSYWQTSGGISSEYGNGVSERPASCRTRYQQTPVDVYAHFLAADHDSGRVTYFVNRRTWLRVTDLVMPLLRVSDPKVAGLRGRILQGRYGGRAEVQVLSPITGRVIGAKEVRVSNDKVTISKLAVRVVSGLQLNISPDSSIENGYVAETSVTRRLTAQYQVRISISS